MRKLLFKLHLYVALAAGVFVVMLGITGAIMAFEPEIDRVLHWKLSYVTPSGHTLSVAEIRAAVERQFPGERIAAYGLEAAPNLSWSVLLRRGQVFVNPYTGEALGVREGGMDLLGYVHQLHLRLLWRRRRSIAYSSFPGLRPLRSSRDWHRIDLPWERRQASYRNR